VVEHHDPPFFLRRRDDASDTLLDPPESLEEVPEVVHPSVIVLFLIYFSSKNGIAVNDIGQYDR
jgi:hypothetical protein